MKLQDWLQEFCKIHERATGGALSPAERTGYLEARDELARALLNAQRIALLPGQKPRQSLRAALALPVSLHLQAGKLGCITQDISAGGFSVILSRISSGETVVPFSLKLAREGAPIEGKARIAGAASTAVSGRVGFAFTDLSPEAAERIEIVVFDAVVAQLRS
jgi:hypothetical protein